MTENSFTVKTFLIHIAIGIAAGLLETLTAHFCQPIIPLYMDSIWNAASSFYSLASGVTCGVVFQIAVVLLGFSKPSSLVFTICSLTITLTVRLFMRCCPRLLNLTQKILGVLFLIIALTFLISIEGVNTFFFSYLFFFTKYADILNFLAFYDEKCNAEKHLGVKIVSRIPAITGTQA